MSGMGRPLRCSLTLVRCAPEQVTEVRKLINDGVASGEIQPLINTVFPEAHAEDAFRYLSKGESNPESSMHGCRSRHLLIADVNRAWPAAEDVNTAHSPRRGQICVTLGWRAGMPACRCAHWQGHAANVGSGGQSGRRRRRSRSAA